MPGKTWKQVFEEKSKLERQEDLISMRNLLDGIVRLGKVSKDFPDFINNLEKLKNKIDEEIDK